MSREKREKVEVDVSIKRETDLAYLVEDADGREIWLPKWRCSVDGTAVLVEEWLAEKEGLI